MFMITGLGSMATSCLGGCAAACACGACKCLGDGLARTSARAVYVLYFILAVGLSWVMRDYAQPLMAKIPWLLDVLDHQTVVPSDAWLGKQAVYRVSMGSCLFFSFMSVMLVGTKYKSDPRDRGLQRGGWALKSLAWLLCLAFPFFLSTGAINAYVWLARIGGGSYLIIQMIILLDFTQVWNDSWVSKESNSWLVALLVVTVGCYAVSIAIAAVLFIFFVPHSDCSLNTFFITWTLIMCLAFSVISLHPAIPNGSIFPSAVITLYSFYLNYSALVSEPTSYECNQLGRSFDASTGPTLAIGMAITIGSVVYSALRAGSSDIWGGTGDEMDAELPKDEERPLLAPGEAPGAVSVDRDAISVEDYEPVSYNYAFFHLTFALASMYIAMLMTGWSSSEDIEANTVDVGWASVWVKMSYQWITGLLYTWTLLAPILMPGRDFS